MDEIRQNLFGNSTGPVPIPGKTATEAIPNQESIDQTAINNQMSTATTDSPTSGQACLIVGIWDYRPAGPSQGDLAFIQGAYTAIVYNANYAGYNYVATLQNQDATHANIWQWLTWLCFYYQNVDVYLLGHGVYTGAYAYCPYDSMWLNYVSDFGCLYYSGEMQSWGVHPYEYKQLRLGLGGFCFSAGFYPDFVYQPIQPGYPPMSDSKTRVWMGGWGSILDWYTEYFCVYWGYSWYVQNYDSLTAYNIAYDESLVRAWNGQTISYFYNNMGEQSITFPAVYYLEIQALDEYNIIVYNAEIYLDYNYVGTGTAYVQVTPGWHFIDATNPVYDDYLGRDVWLMEGYTGSFFISGSTLHEIRYN